MDVLEDRVGEIHRDIVRNILERIRSFYEPNEYNYVLQYSGGNIVKKYPDGSLAYTEEDYFSKKPRDQTLLLSIDIKLPHLEIDLYDNKDIFGIIDEEIEKKRDALNRLSQIFFSIDIIITKRSTI